jgi:hypothetical protein
MLVPSEMKVVFGSLEWRSVRKLAGGLGLLCCFSLFALGCGGGKRAAEHVDVTGKVTIDNKPVTGGRVTFVSIPKDPKDQPFASAGVIDEKGNYSIKAPPGPVKITVDTSMLNQNLNAAAKKVAGRGAGKPDAPEPDPIKGTFVPIPMKYKTSENTDLTWTVSKDQPTHDIELKSK